MEKEIAIFQAELERYEAETTKCYYSNWSKSTEPRFLSCEPGYRYWLENRIKSNNKMIAELQLLLNKLHEKKQALMKDIKGYMAEAIQAKEDSDGLMLKFKTEMWDLKDDIVRARKKCFDKKRQMFYGNLDKLDLKEIIYFSFGRISTPDDDIVAKKAKEPPQNKDKLYEAEYGVVIDETKAVMTEEEAESDDVKSITDEAGAAEETGDDEIDADVDEDQDKIEEIF